MSESELMFVVIVCPMAGLVAMAGTMLVRWIVDRHERRYFGR